ncbi:hypothetical protein MKX03_003119 [Papaver bracteatum]|nr:hypothetical protein MKX03_003119 [Papaver bracteatum]
MIDKELEAIPIGTTAVALHFNGGAVIAAHRGGTVDRTTRACTIAGPSGEVLRSLEDAIRDRINSHTRQLVKAEKTEEPLKTVEESAGYLLDQFDSFEAAKIPTDIEMMVAGWDNMKKVS